MNPPFETLLPKRPEIDNCPDCNTSLSFEFGTPSDYDNPAIDDVWYCENCGYLSDEIPNYQVYPIINEKTKELDSFLHSFTLEPEEYTIDGIFEHLPDEDFQFGGEEAGVWHVYSCDDEECTSQWHYIGYIETFGRRDGKRFIEIQYGDPDGDWQPDLYWEDGMDDKEILSWYGTIMDRYFLDWAKYFLYCAKHGVDPLNQFTNSYRTSDDFYLACVEACERNIRYLTMKGEKS